MSKCTIKRLINYSHLYLCGHIDIKLSAKEFLSKTKYKWIKEVVNKDLYTNIRKEHPNTGLEKYSYTELCNMYYESFIDSLVSVDGRDTSAPYNETAHYILNVEKECQLIDKRLSIDSWTFKVLNLHIFFFPYSICLFAIEIEEAGVCNANDLTIAHLCLREVNSYMEMEIEKDKEDSKENKAKQLRLNLNQLNYLDAIEPLFEFLPTPRELDNKYSWLTHTGNKLKAFQIILSDTTDSDFLFELATLSPIGCVKYESNNFSPSEEYYNKLINENSISIFRNWKALALFDTYTVLFDCKKDISSESVNEIRENANKVIFAWRNYYFRLIYIHSLYQKTMLFSVNKKFRSGDKTKECRHLLQEMKVQEHWYAFSNISYNFLPQLIYESIDHGLEIGKERESLRKYIEQESERQDKLNEFKIGKLVLYITAITILSALYDGSSLIRELLFIQQGNKYFIAIFCILLIVISIGGFILYKRYKNLK